MSTIIVYKRAGTNPIALSPGERREGMKDTGDMLRDALSTPDGSANDTDADDRVKDVLDKLIGKLNSSSQTVYDVRFEESQLANIKYKLDGKIDRRGRYKLTHPTNIGLPENQQNQALNGKLRLDVGLDDHAPNKNIFKMRLTVPMAAANSGSWIYLTDDINGDVNIVEADPNDPITKTQNYLISTFMFSRCR